MPDPADPNYFFASTQYALSTSFDGSVIGGLTTVFWPQQGFQSFTPFRWTQADGLQLIAHPDGRPTGSGAIDMSDDGDTLLIGDELSPSLRSLWTEATGIIPLTGILNGPARMSGDAHTIISARVTGGTTVSSVWRDGVSTEFTAFLSSYGVSTAGWTNLNVTDVNGNGTAFCGYGRNSLNQVEAWYATIPAPSSAVLGAVALVVVRRRRR